MTNEQKRVDRDRVMLQAILDGRRDAEEVAEELGMSQEEVATWVGLRGNCRAVAAVRVLHDAQAMVQLSRYRLYAVQKLARLVTDDGVHPETARKAAQAILSLDLMDVCADVPPEAPPAPGSKKRPVKPKQRQAKPVAVAMGQEPEDRDEREDKRAERNRQRDAYRRKMALKKKIVRARRKALGLQVWPDEEDSEMPVPPALSGIRWEPAWLEEGLSDEEMKGWDLENWTIEDWVKANPGLPVGAAGAYDVRQEDGVRRPPPPEAEAREAGDGGG